MTKLFTSDLRRDLSLVMVLSAAPSYAQQPAGAVRAQQPPDRSIAAAPASSATIPSPAAARAGSGRCARGRGCGETDHAIGRLRELSPWSMFLSADNLVKAVMISLVFASLATWTILLAKTIQLSRGGRRLARRWREFPDARSLAEAQIGVGFGRRT